MAEDRISLEKIIKYSKREFLNRGYKNSSLRSIAAAAGLTTGAIYCYFDNKDALFCSLVDEVCEDTKKLFTKLSETYYDSNGGTCELNMQKSIQEIREVYRFIYDCFDEWRLLICCSDGSSKADYVHTLVDYEVGYCRRYLRKLGESKNADFSIDDTILHILCNSYINSLLEPVRHNMSYEEAIINAEFLCTFFTGGWVAIIESLLSGEK